MRLPGRVWLSFEAAPALGGGQTDLIQTTYFAPKGLPGLLYWYGLYPIHSVIFARMVKNLAASATRFA